MRLLSLCVLLLSAGPLASVAHAQYPTPPDTVGTPVEGPILEPESSAEANHAEDPNRVPYETEKNVGVEVLRLPATLWRGFGDVVGLGVKWAEYSGTIDRLLNYAAPKGPAPIWGFAPVFSVGGRDGLVLGGRLFHRDLFGAGLRGRVGGRYAFGSTNTYSAHLGLAHPAPFGGPLALGLDGEFEQDGEERFYLVGNDTAEEERVPYERQYGRGALSAGLRLGGPFRLAGDVSYEYADVSPDEDFSELPAGDIAEALGTPGLGPFRQADLLEGGLGIALDLSRTGGLRAPRTYAGTVVILAYRYGTDLGSEPLAYHRIAADVRQYVPLPFLPRDRRLALRAYYEMVHPPDDLFVPF
ncbi:MAG: hypothetical protein R3362_10500, partial [Rhodothermales bacterium]|nr:hypothetical protein [Rhodothermales bacterium]